MEDANRKLQNPQDIDAPKGPTILQHHVVQILDADAGQFAKYVEAVGKILELDQLDLPRTSLLRNDGLESDGGIAMPASSVVEDDVNFFHGSDSAIDESPPGRATFMPCG